MGNRRYFDELDQRARIADLEIETMRVDRLQTLDFENLTLGQIITLANVVAAVRLLQSEPFTSTEETGPPPFLSPAKAERRGRPGPAHASRDGSVVQEAESITKEQVRDLLTSIIAPDAPIPTVAGPVLYKDIPRDEAGNIVAGWLDENCTCDDHEKARIGKAKESDDSIARGLYL